jgi:tetratricopeptide (TPR) repeat protein
MSFSKTIKLFVSSTFLDFKKERNALQQLVYPRLKELCQAHGFNFQPVDLRWGVSKEVIENNQAIDFCLNEVSRCSNDPQPSLLVLMGQRYGWVPIPTRLSRPEFDAINEQLDIAESGLLKSWYTLDTNHIPPAYNLNNKAGIDDWASVEGKLRAIFTHAHSESICPNENFNYSATEREIRYALEKQNLKSTLYIRSFEQSDKHSEFISESASEKASLAGLKEYLLAQDFAQNVSQTIGIKHYLSIDDDRFCDDEVLLDSASVSNYIRGFCKQLHDVLAQQITQEIKSFKLKTPLQIELIEQANIQEEKSANVVGRDNIVADITNFVTSQNKAPFYLLHGPSGMGKSSVMAETIRTLQVNDKLNIIYRFVGTTEHSSSILGVFKSIAEQLSPDTLFTIDVNDKKAFFEQLANLFLQKNNHNQTVIFLDGLDQAQEFDDSVELLLSQLVGIVKLVVSVVSSSGIEEILDYPYFEALKHTTRKHQIEPLKDTENNIVIKRLLALSSRTLSDAQLAILGSSCANKSPLFTYLACKITTHWQSHKTYASDDLGESESDMIKQFFANVITNNFHKKAIVENTLGLIAGSKMGLSEIELLTILSEQEELLKIYNQNSESSPQLSRLPDAFFSRLYFDIKEFFSERQLDDEIVIYPAHQIITDTIKTQYYQNNSKKLHSMLIGYFSVAKNVKRKARELTWSQFCLQDKDALFITLLDSNILTISFDLYGDGLELRKYVNLIKAKYPNYSSDVVKHYLTQSETSFINEGTVKFFNVMGFLGGIPIPMLQQLIDDADSFENDSVFFDIKFQLLSAKAFSGKDTGLQEVLEEIKSLLPSISPESNAFFQLSFLRIQIYKTLVDLPLVIKLCKQLLNQFPSENEQHIRILAFLASAYKHSQDNQNAITYYEKVIDYFTRYKGEKHLEVAIAKGNAGQAYRNLGWLNRDQSLMTVAQDHIADAINTVTTVLGANEHRLVSSLNAMGYIIQQQGLLLADTKAVQTKKYFERAQQYFENALDVAKLWGDPRDFLVVSGGLIQNFIFQNNLKTAYLLAQESVCLTMQDNSNSLDTFYELNKNILLKTKSSFEDALSESDFVHIERNALDIIERMLGRSHDYSLTKRLEIIVFLVKINQEQLAIADFNQLDTQISMLSAQRRKEFYDLTELRRKVYLKTIKETLDKGVAKLKTGYLEEGLSLFEQAQAMSLKVGLPEKGAAFELIFAAFGHLYTKYVNSRQIERATFYTEEYYKILATHPSFGLAHIRTQQVKEVLALLHRQQ